MPLARDDGFPAGLRVLVVDDDAICLGVLRQMLINCRYQVTTCTQATQALALLRASTCGFHLVISDVHMPDMDGFRLLEHVGLEMDLPVIMMSVDSRTNVVMRGIKCGACDYLVKPVRMEQLKNIWQHVVRKNWRKNGIEHPVRVGTDCSNQVLDDAGHDSSLNNGDDTTRKYKRRKRNSKEHNDVELESDHLTKKRYVFWSVDLHRQFVNAVNQLGIEETTPNRILELMNVPGLSRETVASHLQKLRLHLKGSSGESSQHGASALPSSFCALGSGGRVSGPLDGLHFRALAASDRIPQETLSSLQDDHPSGGLFLPAMNQQSARASNQLTDQASTWKDAAFGQPLFTSQKSPQPSKATPDVLSVISSWIGNNNLVSAAKLGELDSIGNKGVLAELFQLQQKLARPMARSPTSDVTPSCAVITPGSFNPLLHCEKSMRNQELCVGFQAAKCRSSKSQVTAGAPSESSPSLCTLYNSVPVSQGSSILLEPSGLDHGKGAPTESESQTAIPHMFASFKAGYNPHAYEDSALVETSSPLQDGSSHVVTRDCLNRTLAFSGQSRSVRFGVGQIVPQGLRNPCNAVPSFSTSAASSSTDGSSSWQGQSLSWNNKTSSTAGVPSSASLNSGRNNNRPGRDLGFVGKAGAYIPSRFAGEDAVSPSHRYI